MGCNTCKDIPEIGVWAVALTGRAQDQGDEGGAQFQENKCIGACSTIKPQIHQQSVMCIVQRDVQQIKTK